jgi:16S rRNA (cytidine1402-2'-O)-methyltransferase
LDDKKGTLYLIPTFLGHSEKDLLPPSYIRIIHGLDEFIVENEKPARAFLKSCETPVAMSDLILHPLHKHVDQLEVREYLNSCEEGKDVGLLSDAGLPCIADPGYQLVSLAHNKNIDVFPMHGLSSITMALMASGFNGQQFRFHGYLPHDKDAKRKIVKTMLSDIQRGETQIFIETPYRNGALIKELQNLLPHSIELCVSVDLSLPNQQIMRSRLDLFPTELEFLHKRPAVFVIGV